MRNIFYTMPKYSLHLTHKVFDQTKICYKKNFKGFLFNFGIELFSLDTEISFLFIVFHHRIGGPGHKKVETEEKKLFKLQIGSWEERYQHKSIKKPVACGLEKQTRCLPFSRIICFRQIRALLFTLISFHAEARTEEESETKEEGNLCDFPTSRSKVNFIPIFFFHSHEIKQKGKR